MGTVKALIIDPGGLVTYADIEPTLETFQEIVGGYIEGFRGEEYFAYCNEEGKLKGLPVNELATRVAEFTHDVLCGTVVFLGMLDDEGEETSVAPDVVARALNEGSGVRA